MGAYIDRKQALSHPFANGKYDHEHANKHFIRGFVSYREWLEQLPTINLVRCEECIHHDEDGWGYGECKRPSVVYLRTADEDFCSKAERRTDD